MTASGDGPPGLPALIGGRYRPLRLIAKGGMGAVYEVVHANTGEHLALKLMSARSLLSAENVDRFRREARIQSSVKSEHVVRVIDADVAPEIDGAPFLVMELLAGKDFERIAVERRPSDDDVVSWLGQVAQALDKAHEQRIVHRDLKPENLFLAEREDGPPIVKVLDFGVAKLMTEGEAESGHTQTGQILGTPRYMSPEQAAGDKNVSPAADRFALGLIAFRLLAGRHYFEGDNWVTLLQAVSRGPEAAPSARGCARGAAFDAWFGQACARAPAARFASCDEQVQALAHALADASAGSSGRAWSTSRRGVGVAAAFALAAFALGVSRLRGASAPPPIAPRPAAPVSASVPALPVHASTPSPDAGVARPSVRAPSQRRRAPAAKAAPSVPGADSIWEEP